MRSDGGQTLRPRRVMGSCDVSLWARQDLNLQPTDYESVQGRFADLSRSRHLLVLLDPLTQVRDNEMAS